MAEQPPQNPEDGVVEAEIVDESNLALPAAGESIQDVKVISGGDEATAAAQKGPAERKPWDMLGDGGESSDQLVWGKQQEAARRAAEKAASTTSEQNASGGATSGGGASRRHAAKRARSKDTRTDTGDVPALSAPLATGSVAARMSKKWGTRGVQGSEGGRIGAGGNSWRGNLAAGNTDPSQARGSGRVTSPAGAPHEVGRVGQAVTAAIDRVHTIMDETRDAHDRHEAPDTERLRGLGEEATDAILKTPGALEALQERAAELADRASTISSDTDPVGYQNARDQSEAAQRLHRAVQARLDDEARRVAEGATEPVASNPGPDGNTSDVRNGADGELAVGGESETADTAVPASMPDLATGNASRAGDTAVDPQAILFDQADDSIGRLERVYGVGGRDKESARDVYDLEGGEDDEEATTAVGGGAGAGGNPPAGPGGAEGGGSGRSRSHHERVRRTAEADDDTERYPSLDDLAILNTMRDLLGAGQPASHWAQLRTAAAQGNQTIQRLLANGNGRPQRQPESAEDRQGRANMADLLTLQYAGERDLRPLYTAEDAPALFEAYRTLIDGMIITGRDPQTGRLIYHGRDPQTGEATGRPLNTDLVESAIYLTDALAIRQDIAANEDRRRKLDNLFMRGNQEHGTPMINQIMDDGIVDAISARLNGQARSAFDGFVAEMRRQGQQLDVKLFFGGDPNELRSRGITYEYLDRSLNLMRGNNDLRGALEGAITAEYRGRGISLNMDRRVFNEEIVAAWVAAHSNMSPLSHGISDMKILEWAQGQSEREVALAAALDKLYRNEQMDANLQNRMTIFEQIQVQELVVNRYDQVVRRDAEREERIVFNRALADRRRVLAQQREYYETALRSTLSAEQQAEYEQRLADNEADAERYAREEVGNYAVFEARVRARRNAEGFMAFQMRHDRARRVITEAQVARAERLAAGEAGAGSPILPDNVVWLGASARPRTAPAVPRPENGLWRDVAETAGAVRGTLGRTVGPWVGAAFGQNGWSPEDDRQDLRRRMGTQ